MSRPKAFSGLVREEVPQAMIDIATRRVDPHLRHLAMVDFDLRQLMVNCYMQGVMDTATVLANKGLLDELPEKPNEIVDFQI